jgi:hypothetical protein
MEFSNWVSLIAVCISAMALYQSHLKGRLDIFAPRYEVYFALINYLGFVANNCCKSSNNRGEYEILMRSPFVVNFWAARSKSSFIFDEKINNYLDNIQKNCSILLSSGWSHAVAEDGTPLSTWILEEFKAAEKQFSPYLNQLIGIPPWVVLKTLLGSSWSRAKNICSNCKQYFQSIIKPWGPR